MIKWLEIINRIENLHSQRWTSEEDAIIIANYSIRPPEEICDLLPYRSINAIKLRGNKLGLHQYTNSKFHNVWTDEELKYLKNNWRNLSDVQIGDQLHRTARAVKAKRNELKLMRQEHGRDISYDDLSKYLRGNTWQWKLDSIAKCNGQCVLTGSKDYAIHYLYNFGNILKEYVSIYDMPLYDDINQYTSQQLEYIVKTFNEYHNTYPLGICVAKDLHKLFHHIYGKTNNTPEQWETFAKKYKKGIINH